MNSKKTRILIVDDDEAGRHLLTKILSRSGHSITIAKNGNDALEKFMSQRPDLVITDVKMPIMDGFELATEIRRNKEFAHIPIIFISAMFKDIASKTKGMDIGGNEYLTLPVDKEDLIHKVNVMLKNKRLYDELLSSKEALHESEKKYRALFESATDAIYLVSPISQRILDCNAKAAEMSGYSKTQLKTMLIADLHPEEEQDIVSKIFKKIIKMGSLSGISGINHLSKDGNKVPIEINAATIEISGKTFCLGIFRDITDRKKAENSTRLTKEEWEKTFDSVPDMIAIIDKNFRITKANKAMVKKLGIKRSDLIGQVCYEMMHGTDQPPSFCPHSMTIGESKANTIEIYEENLKGFYMISSTPLRDSDGKAVGVVEVVRDITAQKKLEKKLQDLAAKDDLNRTTDTSMRNDEELFRHKRSKSSVKEKRFHNRYSVSQDFTAEIRNAGTAEITNISLGGICLKSPNVLKKDTVYEIAIQNSSGKIIESDAVVVRTPLLGNKKAKNMSPLRYDTGMRFIRLSRASQQSLDRLIAGLKKSDL